MESPGKLVLVVHPLLEDWHEGVQLESGLLCHDVHRQLDQELGGHTDVLVESKLGVLNFSPFVGIDFHVLVPCEYPSSHDTRTVKFTDKVTCILIVVQ